MSGTSLARVRSLLVQARNFWYIGWSNAKVQRKVFHSVGCCQLGGKVAATFARCPSGTGLRIPAFFSVWCQRLACCNQPFLIR